MNPVALFHWPIKAYAEDGSGSGSDSWDVLSHQVSVEPVDDPGIDNSHMAIAISKGLMPWKVGRSETRQGDDSPRRRRREFLEGGWGSIDWIDVYRQK